MPSFVPTGQKGAPPAGGKSISKGTRTDTEDPAAKRRRLYGDEASMELNLSAAALGKMSMEARQQFDKDLDALGTMQGVIVELEPPLHVAASVGATDAAAG